MADFVKFDINEIREFGRNMESFIQDATDIIQRMNSALCAIKESWQDHQLDAPSTNIMEANARLMSIVGDLAPIVQDYLRRQEQWWEEYTTR